MKGTPGASRGSCSRATVTRVIDGKVRVKRLGTLRDEPLERRQRDYRARLQGGGEGGEVEIFKPRRWTRSASWWSTTRP